MKKIKSVLLVSHELSYTGAPHSLLDIAKILISNNINVEVFSLQDGVFKSEFEKLGIKVSIKSSADFQSNLTIREILKFDLAICNTIRSFTPYNYIRKFIPAVWYIREGKFCRRNCTSICEKVIKKSKDIYTVSEYTAEYYKKVYNNSKVNVVHNSTEDFYDETFIKTSEQKLRVLFMGSIEYRKRPDIIVKAVKTLPERYQSKITLTIAGLLPKDNPNIKYYQPILKNIENIDNISYIGEITNENNKIQLYKNTDIVVVPSMEETCSRVVLEALMMGIPVIITKDTGAKYAVDEKSGWIVETGEFEPISKILSDIIDKKYNLEEMSKHAREKYLETSTMEIYNKNILSMVNNKINKEKYKKYIAPIKLGISLFRKIFNIENSYNTTGKIYKVITIFGIKLKIRNYKKELIELEKRVYFLENNMDSSGKSYAQSNLQEQINKFYLDNYELSELPKFSIIMPVYNRLFCISNAIHSVLNQTYNNYELIIVDDGSTDGTEDFIKSNYKNELTTGKMKYIKQNHQGVSSARNTGLKNCSNDWICYLDSDNAATKNFLETFAVNILKYRYAQIFYGKTIQIYNNIIVGHEFDYNALLKENYIDIGIFVHNKSLFYKYGGFDENLTRLVDWDLIIKYTKDNIPIFIDEILCIYNGSDVYERITNIEKINKNKEKI
ncbi:MAG: glycosyltransferase, partial [Candidatus Gastranaerophilales bacterium]|nr:glycosyltransferase [Candidatus Gastranaerophilales bacterium]